MILPVLVRRHGWRFLGPVLLPLVAAAQAPLPEAGASAPASSPWPSPPGVAASAPGSTRPPAPLAPSTLAGGPDWSALSPAQQQVLAPLQAEWKTLDGARKGKWLEVAARVHSLPPEQQDRIRQRMQEWALLSAAERQRTRAAYLNLLQAADPKRRQSPEAVQDKLQSKWEAYQALSPEERQRLTEKAAQRASSERPAHKPAQPATKPGAQVVAAPPLIPVAEAPSLVQARPGASTVLITQGAQARPASSLRLPLAAGDALDPHTLLPRTKPR